MTLEDTIAAVTESGFENVRALPNGELIGTQRMIFTTGLFVGLDPWSFRTRYCYEHHGEAVDACRTWDGAGDPPGMWIKQKPEDRLNPQWVRSREQAA